MLLGTLGASLLRKMLAGRRAIATSQGRGINTAEEWMVRAGYGSKKKLIPSHDLTNCKIHKYYQNETRFNGVYSRDNIRNKIKDGGYVINLDEYSDIGTCQIAL